MEQIMRMNGLRIDADPSHGDCYVLVDDIEDGRVRGHVVRNGQDRPFRVGRGNSSFWIGFDTTAEERMNSESESNKVFVRFTLPEPFRRSRKIPTEPRMRRGTGPTLRAFDGRKFVLSEGDWVAKVSSIDNGIARGIMGRKTDDAQFHRKFTVRVRPNGLWLYTADGYRMFHFGRSAAREASAAARARKIQGMFCSDCPKVWACRLGCVREKKAARP